MNKIWAIMKVLFILYAIETNKLMNNIHFFDDTIDNVTTASDVIKVQEEPIYDNLESAKEKVEQKFNKVIQVYTIHTFINTEIQNITYEWKKNVSKRPFDDKKGRPEELFKMIDTEILKLK